VHGGYLLGELGPGCTRPTLKDQGHPEPKGEALLAADARGSFRMPMRLLSFLPVLMESLNLSEFVDG
jgi:hypothetical protein